MKTGLLEVRPIFVRKARRTRAHVLVTMLALKVVREMRRGLVAAFGTTADDKMASVSHLLHMTFVLGLCGSLCYPCFVKPAPCCESACSPSYRTLVLFLADM